jgi:hypothetical protein
LTEHRGGVTGRCAGRLAIALPLPAFEGANPRGGALQLEPARVGIGFGMQRLLERSFQFRRDRVAMVDFAFEMRFRDVTPQPQFLPLAFERGDLRVRVRETGRADVRVSSSGGSDALGLSQRLTDLDPGRFRLRETLLAF